MSITVNGKTYKNTTELLKTGKVSRSLYYKRIKDGFSIEDAVNTPVSINKEIERPYIDFGNKIALLRKSMELTQSGFANALYEFAKENGYAMEKKTRFCIASWENGTRMPKAYDFIVLLKFVNLPADIFL